MEGWNEKKKGAKDDWGESGDTGALHDLKKDTWPDSDPHGEFTSGADVQMPRIDSLQSKA